MAKNKPGAQGGRRARGAPKGHHGKGASPGNSGSGKRAEPDEQRTAYQELFNVISALFRGWILALAIVLFASSLQWVFARLGVKGFWVIAIEQLKSIGSAVMFIVYMFVETKKWYEKNYRQQSEPKSESAGNPSESKKPSE